jgi:phage shock protein C
MTSSATPPPVTDQPPARRQLRRSATDRMIGGVCGGLADYSGIDAVLWRVGAVALTLCGPGLFVYLALWVLMPPADTRPEDRSGLEEQVVRLHTRLTGGRATAHG